MRLQLDRPLVIFDLETTGLDTKEDRIVEIGLVKVMPDGSRERLCELVDPGIDIPEQATKVHGIETSEVRGLFGKPQLPKLADKILDFMGDGDLGGFNSLGYDLPMWEAECKRHDIPFHGEGRKHVDVKVIFHAKETAWDRFLMGPRNLTNAVRHYLGKDPVNRFQNQAHRADADAEMTLEVLLAQLVRYEDLPTDVQGLHKFCSDRLREQERMREAV